MNKLGLVDKVSRFADKNSPAILTGLGIAGMFSTVAMVIKTTPKALYLIDGQELTKKEIVKKTWKCYVPAMAMGGFSTLCLVSGHSVNMKRNAALASVYSLTNKSLREYQAAVIEQVGEKKAGSIRDKIAEKKIKDNPPENSEVVFTDKGDVLCYEGLSGRYFKSDISEIHQAINRLNRLLLLDTHRFATLNDAYYELGLSNTRLGDLMGWHIDDGEIDVHFSSQLTEEKEPCLVINFNIEPRYIDFD